MTALWTAMSICSALVGLWLSVFFIGYFDEELDRFADWLLKPAALGQRLRQRWKDRERRDG